MLTEEGPYAFELIVLLERSFTFLLSLFIILKVGKLKTLSQGMFLVCFLLLFFYFLFFILRKKVLSKDTSYFAQIQVYHIIRYILIQKQTLDFSFQSIDDNLLFLFNINNCTAVNLKKKKADVLNKIVFLTKKTKRERNESRTHVLWKSQHNPRTRFINLVVICIG